MDLSETAGSAPLCCAVRRGSEVLGYVAIDSTIGGRSCGGLRMLPDVDEAEMAGLARAMTLKYGFLGLPQGGAKAGVRGDPEAAPEIRRQRLRDFGEAISPLLRSRRYTPHPDMGTDNGDIVHMLEAAGVRVKRRELRCTDSAYYTAVTVWAAARQTARWCGMDLSACRIAIGGYGKVGRALAGLFASAGVRVVAVSTSRGAIYAPQGLDVARLEQLAAATGSEVVNACADGEQMRRETLWELPVDILCPCARHDSIHAGNARAVAARIICAGANNPVTPEARRCLSERGVVCVPDFVSNCGGVLGGTMEFAAVRRERIARFLDQQIGMRVEWLLAEAARRRLLPHDLAVEEAMRRFDRVRQRAERPRLRGRLFEAGLEAHRRGWLPRGLVGSLAMPYFERVLAS